MNLKTENSVSTYFDDIKTAYLYSYDAGKRRLYFLKAVTEGEICVPYNWTELNYLDVTEHNPLKNIGEKEARMLGLSRLWSAVSRNFVFMNRVKISWDSLYVDNMKRMYEQAYEYSEEDRKSQLNVLEHYYNLLISEEEQ